MADAVDMAFQISGEHIANAIALATKPIAPGTAGECDQCEWWMPRLVEGRCGFCRDGRPRPPDWDPPVPPGAAVTPPVTPPTSTSENPMSGKSIMLPASADTAIVAVETRASTRSTSLGTAAAELIDAGQRAIDMPIVATASPPSLPDDLSPFVRLLIEHGGSVDELVADLVARATAGAGRDAEVAELTARAEAAEARAVAVEGKLQSLREALAA